jgi:HK97 family phage prohead protease
MDILWAGAAGELEVRRERGGGTRLRGSFPYGKPAVLSDGGRTGRPKKEVIAPHGFAFRVNDPSKEIHLLLGHDFGQPLASKLTGTLELKDTAEALLLDATITPQIADTSFGRDALAMIGAGLAFGISPGFRLPPERAVPRAEAETITQEPDRPDEGMHRAIIRTVNDALLYELSVVTRPAYKESQIEARNWDLDALGCWKTQCSTHLRRYRL